MKTFIRQLVLMLIAMTVSASAATNSLESIFNSRTDVWGEAAMQQPNGASYEFFRDLLPQLRYVNADFRVYPMVLSAPSARRKARLVSDGSGLNLRANTRNFHDFGTAVLYRVGASEAPFGDDLQRLDGPHLTDGYLPIVQMRYEHNGFYSQETFASVLPTLSSNAVVFSRFRFQVDPTPEHDKKGIVTVRVESRGALKALDGRVENEQGETLVWFDKTWKWDTNRSVLVATLLEAETPSAAIAVATYPLDHSVDSPLNNGGYDTQRKLALETWQGLLLGRMHLETPEPIVNNAWRALLLQNFSIINGDSLRYSSANQYDALYETEGSDALTAMLIWGYETESRRWIVPLLDFVRDGIKYQQAGTKLQNVARYYWQTRDAAILEELAPKWKNEAHRIVDNLGKNGLLPRERYCNDIATPIFSLNSNSKCWRGLRDLGAVLNETGDKAEASRLLSHAAQLRSNILSAVEKSVVTNTVPPFVPVALFGEEPPPDPICATRMGSYWNLLINFVIGNEALGPGSRHEDWMLHYIQQHGGLVMGMETSRPWPGWWNLTLNVNPLYGTRYVLTLLRRDEPDRALVSFYGMLSQGMTRETFYAGEGSSLMPLNSEGRQISMPPNSAGNAHLLTMLRSLVVQDLDLNDDGKPETLRLGFATPPRWLEDGKQYKVERAPTAFGPVSFSMQSRLQQGVVIAEVDLPRRNKAERILVRARVPSGWKVASAHVGDVNLPIDNGGAIDLSALNGKQTIRFSVQR